MLEIAIILVLIGAFAALAAPWIMRRRGAGNDWVHGNLLVTGVINGPTVDEHVVYQQLAVDVDDWPTMGQLFAVVYAPNNPDRWTFAPPEVMPPG